MIGHLATKPYVIYPLALALRIALIVYGEWQDRTLAIKYTDVDYEVISDAAASLIRGGSPYDRATYRYSPLLAWLLVPNFTLHKCWGKVIFSTADLMVGRLLQTILMEQGHTPGTSLQHASLWLLNPLSINVSTRGSFDSVTSALVLGTVAALLRGSHLLAAVVFGIVVHMRVYPVIYAPAFVFFLFWRSYDQLNRSKRKNVWYLVSWMRHYRRPLLFAFLSAMTFFACTAACVWGYGQEFVHHALLYHLTRTDNRHNYSLYWYWIYLDYSAPHRLLLGFVAFIPQVMMLLGSAFYLSRELALCVVAQTSLFVFFNKVFTGQYLTWYLCLAPLLTPRMKVDRYTSLALAGSWLLTLLLWLYLAWNLEMKGRNVFLPLWAASVLLFAANLATVNACIRGFDYRSTQLRSR